jgi:hypothetical protein
MAAFAVNRPLEFAPCLNHQCRASIVTRSSGALRPPSLLLVELPVLVGPSIGPYPWKRTLLVSIVIFHPNVTASSHGIPLDAMVSRFCDLKALHTSISVDICFDHTRDGNAEGQGFNMLLKCWMVEGVVCPRCCLWDWRAQGLFPLNICTRITAAMLLVVPVLAMLSVSAFDLVSWCPGEDACMWSSHLEVTRRIR